MKKIAILAPLLLAGCAFDGAHPQAITYPDSLFTCPDKPDPTTVQTDNDVAELLVRQDSIITICKDKLRNVGDLVRANQPGAKPVKPAPSNKSN